jgi:hypothetical protein
MTVSSFSLTGDAPSFSPTKVVSLCFVVHGFAVLTGRVSSVLKRKYSTFTLTQLEESIPMLSRTLAWKLIQFVRGHFAQIDVFKI